MAVGAPRSTTKKKPPLQFLFLILLVGVQLPRVGAFYYMPMYYSGGYNYYYMMPPGYNYYYTGPSVSPTSSPAPTITFTPTQAPYVPRNSSMLKDAVKLWCNDEEDALKAYGPISKWDTSRVTDMESLLAPTSCYEFNEDISEWDVKSVTTMKKTFDGAEVFNQDISAWNVSAVTTMESMFSNAMTFNQDISSWDVSRVTNTYQMFYYAVTFNYDLSNWDISSVKPCNESMPRCSGEEEDDDNNNGGYNYYMPSQMFSQDNDIRRNTPGPQSILV